MAQYTTKTLEIALVAATPKTLLEVTAGAADQGKVKEWWIEFDGTNAAAVPVLVQVLRKTATITGSASPPALLKKNPADGTVAATVKHNATAEGTDGDVLYSHHVHPQAGKHVMFPLGDEIQVGLSGLIAIKGTAPAAVNAVCGFGWEE